MTIQVTSAIAATVPTPTAISKALDRPITSALIGQVSAMAASTTQGATTVGYGVTTTARGLVPTVGTLAMTPKEMETAGIIKPGASTLVTALVAKGLPLQKALTPNLFTGVAGAESLKSLAANPIAQVTAATGNLSVAQKALTSAGAITSNLAGVAIAGLVLSAAKNGVPATLAALKNGLSGIGDKLNSIKDSIAGGNFAAKLGAGLSSIADKVKGAAAGAFAAVTSTFKALKARVPQNLTAIANGQASSTTPTTPAPSAWKTDPDTGQTVRNYSAEDEAKMRESSANINATLSAPFKTAGK
jgi:hypothetical protein